MEGSVNFETKVAVLVRDDLAVWQKLNVAAFLGHRHCRRGARGDARAVRGCCRSLLHTLAWPAAAGLRRIGRRSAERPPCRAGAGA